MFIINTVSTCFGHHNGHLQENKDRRTITFTVLAPYNTAPHNRYQPHPAEPAQHTACSNTCLGLLKMGIMMPETCWDSVDNKHLIVASCWFSLSLHKVLWMSNSVNSYNVLHISNDVSWVISSTVVSKRSLTQSFRFTAELLQSRLQHTHKYMCTTVEELVLIFTAWTNLLCFYFCEERKRLYCSGKHRRNMLHLFNKQTQG